jgi:hypothetical protein
MKRLLVLSLLLLPLGLLGSFRPIDPGTPYPLWTIDTTVAKGPTLSGVIFVEIDGVSQADSVRVTARLSNGTDLESVFAVTGPVNVAVPDLQNAILAALAPEVKATFYPTQCANGCSGNPLLLKALDNVRLTFDDQGRQLAVGDITVALAKKL